MKVISASCMTTTLMNLKIIHAVIVDSRHMTQQMPFSQSTALLQPSI